MVYYVSKKLNPNILNMLGGGINTIIVNHYLTTKPTVYTNQFKITFNTFIKNMDEIGIGTVLYFVVF